MRVSRSRWSGAIVIFVLSLLLRAPMLGSFITTDEPRWMERSQNFAAALFVPNLECPPVNHGRATWEKGLGCTIQLSYPAGRETGLCGECGTIRMGYGFIQA